MTRINPSYLLCSYGKFFFRMNIPKDLRHYFNTKELKRAIPTENRRVAEKYALVYAAEALKTFSKLRENLTMSDTRLLNFSRLEVAVQPDGTTNYKIDPANMAAELDLLMSKGLLRMMDGTVVPMKSHAQPEQTSQEPEVSSSSPPETTSEQIQEPKNDKQQRTSPQTKDGRLLLSPNLLLKNAIEFYLADRQNSKTKFLKKDEDTIKSLLNRMLDSIGNIPLKKIAYHHADEFREALKRCPKVITTDIRSNMSLFELIEDVKVFQELYANFRIIIRAVSSTSEEYAAARRHAPKIIEKLDLLATGRESARLCKLRMRCSDPAEVINQFYASTKKQKNKYNACARLATHSKLLELNTVSQRLTTCSSMFKRLYDLSNGEIRNPFFRVSVKCDKSRRNARQRFTSTDLTTLFNGPIWTQHKYNNTYEYWLPLLLLFTGARIAEILQLENKDIRQTDGTKIWYISVNDTPTDHEEDIWKIVDKSLKTLSSERCFPIHPKLLELGFLDFCNALPGNRLFDYKLVGDTFSRAPSRRFNEFILERAGVKTPKKVLYSFRHTTLDILKQNLVHMEIRSQLAGHATRSTTGDIYGDEFQVNTLLPILMLIDLDAELQNVKPWVDSPTIPPYHARMKDMMSSFHKYQEAIFVAPYISPFALRSMSILQLLENANNDSGGADSTDNDSLITDSDIIEGEIIE